MIATVVAVLFACGVILVAGCAPLLLLVLPEAADWLAWKLWP